MKELDKDILDIKKVFYSEGSLYDFGGVYAHLSFKDDPGKTYLVFLAEHSEYFDEKYLKKL